MGWPFSTLSNLAASAVNSVTSIFTATDNKSSHVSRTLQQAPAPTVTCTLDLTGIGTDTRDRFTYCPDDTTNVITSGSGLDNNALNTNGDSIISTLDTTTRIQNVLSTDPVSGQTICTPNLVSTYTDVVSGNSRTIFVPKVQDFAISDGAVTPNLDTCSVPPTPSPSNPTPSPSNPTPSPSNPTPSPSNPTPSPSNPTPSPSNPTPSPSNPTPSPSNPTPSPTPVEPPVPTPGEPTTPPAKKLDDLTHIGTGLMILGGATAAIASGVAIKTHVSNGNAPVGGNSSVLPSALVAITGGVVAAAGAIFFGVYGCTNNKSFLYEKCPNNKPAEAPTTAPTESNQAQSSSIHQRVQVSKSAENVLSTKAHAELSYYEQVSEYVQNSVSNAPKAFAKGAAVSSVTGVISGGLKEALKDTQYAEYTEYLDAWVNVAGAIAFGGPLAGTIMATSEFAKIATQGTQYEATVSNISTAVSLVSSVLGGAYTAGAALAKPLARGVGQGVVQTAKYALGYEQEQPKAEEVAEDLETGKAQQKKPQAPKESWSSWVQRGVAYGTSTVGKLAVDGVSYSAKYAKDTASSWVSQTTSTDVEQGQAR